MNKKGFTLIELLVVIAIIGLLSTLAVVALGNARQKSRDARRISDIKQIQTALELYLNDNGDYPDEVLASGTCPEAVAAVNVVGGCCLQDDAVGIAAACTVTDVYMNTIPSDPDQDGAQVYTYHYDGTTTYSLGYTLEGDTAGIPSGSHNATPAGICGDENC